VCLYPGLTPGKKPVNGISQTVGSAAQGEIKAAVPVAGLQSPEIRLEGRVQRTGKYIIGGHGKSPFRKNNATTSRWNEYYPYKPY